ncbi:MAG: tRNA epoxyqueuosine(34) reductase QueG [Verrucomicrobia bacterium]|nr:tRNA epoxyqueuosine(34) reductase QueG [Verrucomicrobiota bacterium]
MKTRIRARAIELGFDACRITNAAPPATAARFTDWLASQQHGEMAYLERNAHKRTDLLQVLPEAKSVITLAASYEIANRKSQIANRPNTGLVARYARFADYHDVLAERLKQLTDYVNSIGVGTRSLWYVDTGPFLERDLAQRAGLGFVGKHTNLISRQLGNWIFLAEIITSLELEPDAPEKNRCGSCTRCMAACPTGAITAPFQLDARRCISYLTIELKGSIPVEFRPAIGNRIFGCDDCLAVCPWNRFAREGKLMRDHARSDLAAPDLVELLALDEAAFKQRFAGTPMLRTKRRGLLRNVCVALGNVGDSDAVPALNRAAADSDALIAEHARWALDQIQSRSSPGQL